MGSAYRDDEQVSIHFQNMVHPFAFLAVLEKSAPFNTEVLKYIFHWFFLISVMMNNGRSYE